MKRQDEHESIIDDGHGNKIRVYSTIDGGTRIDASDLFNSVPGQLFLKGLRHDLLKRVVAAPESEER